MTYIINLYIFICLLQMKLCIVLLVLCCAALQHTDAIQFGRWPLRWWPRPGPIGIYRPDIEKPFKGEFKNT